MANIQVWPKSRKFPISFVQRCAESKRQSQEEKTIGALEKLRKVLREGVRSFIVENDYAYVAEVRLEVFLPT